MARLLTQRFTLFCLLGLGMIQGCVGEVDLQVLRADMETLKQQYGQQDQDIDRQLDTLESHISKPVQELSQTAQTLSELRDETRRLQLSLQEVQREIDGTAFTEDIETAFASLETRLAAIEDHPAARNKSDAKPPKDQPSATQPPAQPSPPVEPPVDKPDEPDPANQPPPIENVAKDTSPQPSGSDQAQSEVDASSTQIAKAVPPDDSPQPPPETRSDETNPPKPDQSPQEEQQQPTAPETASTFDSDVQLYEKALRTYQAGKYDDALVLLKRFREEYTESPLAGNVQYWIGESLYAQQQYKAAIAAFDDVVQNYPDDTKVPAAMLNQGLAFAKLRNVSRARFFLQQVQEKYANSFEADQATETLKQLQP